MIVDDHKLFLDSWKLLLETNPRIKVVALCPDGESALNEIENASPDIILMDINMGPNNGFSTTKKILEKNADIKIIGISVNNQATYALRMLEVGGKGYLTKTSSFEEINRGIENVHAGAIYISEEVRRHMPPEYR